MALQRGDVVLVPFPFSDLSATKVRPAIVVSSSLYHAHEPDLILVAITSNLAAASGPFDYIIRDWSASGLRFPSAFKPVVFTLEPPRVMARIGALSTLDLAEIDRRLPGALGV